MLIDVRTKDEYEDGHHDGAINIPLDEIPTHKFDIPFDEKIILYCRSGGRAGVAMQLLKRKGFTNISLLNNTGAYE